VADDGPQYDELLQKGMSLPEARRYADALMDAAMAVLAGTASRNALSALKDARLLLDERGSVCVALLGGAILCASTPQELRACYLNYWMPEPPSSGGR
jgi:hypothetical protein